MLSKLYLFTGILLFLNFSLIAQDKLSLKYGEKVAIEFNRKLNGSSIGGLSSICYNSQDGSFYLVADKPPSRIFKTKIDPSVPLEISFEKCLELTPATLKRSELEGIVYNSETNSYYVSDEQKEGTRILEISAEAKFIRVLEPQNSPFLPLSGHNSGIEGLTISDNMAYLYYSFERPTIDCLEKGFVELKRKSLKLNEADVRYFYQLHTVNGDILNTNGISDILYLNEFQLLIMERAYIPGIGNIVRIFQVDTDSQYQSLIGVTCEEDIIVPIPSKLLFDFVNVDDLKVDNAEGMTFSADKSKLYIITDNNFSRKQETQLIILNVEWF